MFFFHDFAVQNRKNQFSGHFPVASTIKVVPTSEKVDDFQFSVKRRPPSVLYCTENGGRRFFVSQTPSGRRKYRRFFIFSVRFRIFHPENRKVAPKIENLNNFSHFREKVGVFYETEAERTLFPLFLLVFKKTAAKNEKTMKKRSRKQQTSRVLAVFRGDGNPTDNRKSERFRWKCQLFHLLFAKSNKRNGKTATDRDSCSSFWIYKKK